MEALQPVPFAAGCATRTRQMPTPWRRLQPCSRFPAMGKCMENHKGYFLMILIENNTKNRTDSHGIRCVHGYSA